MSDIVVKILTISCSETVNRKKREAIIDFYIYIYSVPRYFFSLRVLKCYLKQNKSKEFLSYSCILNDNKLETGKKRVLNKRD